MQEGLMQLAWLSDIHLNFLEEAKLRSFTDQVAKSGADAVLISGDIAQAVGVGDILFWFADHLSCPIYFVLGNHDYYTGSIEEVREKVAKLSDEHDRLFWLPKTGPVKLSDDTMLVGHGSWADGRFGDWDSSNVELNDYVVIKELAGLDRDERGLRIAELADDAALSLQQSIFDCIKDTERIIVATHVPPFQQSCWNEGTLADDNWLPHFSCRVVGELLKEIMQTNPDKKMLVLCGHTHTAAQARILPNLEVLTAGSEYGEPKIQRVIDLAKPWWGSNAK
jgi:3',5'-cyclic AMP phosphodiesterase CpdA